MRHLLLGAILFSSLACPQTTMPEPPLKTTPAPLSTSASAPAATAPIERPTTVAVTPPKSAPASKPAPTLTPIVPSASWKPLPKSVKSFPKFSSVRAYAFDVEVNGQPVCRGPLNDDGTLCKTVVAEATLSPEQAAQVTTILASRASYDEPAKCFLPHHGFVFFDEANDPVAAVSLCFMCQNMDARPNLPKMKRIDGYYGINSSTTAKLRALCNELGLPKCDARKPEDYSPKSLGLP